MMQTKTLKKDLKEIGEAISHQLGIQMIKEYQKVNPTDSKGNYIGRNIIEQLLAQPGCVGINFYTAYNETMEKTLVCVGVDEFNKSIITYTDVNKDGSLSKTNAIVADRNKPIDGNWWDDIIEQY